MLALYIFMGVMIVSYGIDGVKSSPKKLDGTVVITVGMIYLLTVIGTTLSH